MSATTAERPPLFLVVPQPGGKGDHEDWFAFSLPRLRDDDEFFAFCQKNELLQIERDAEGNIEVVAPAGTDTGYFNLTIGVELEIWNRQQGRPGYAFDSNTGFTLPNGAVRSPDASWIEKTRYEALSAKQREKFAPICPDFVVELLSPSDSLPKTKTKMDEYLANGAKLGWLIDRKNRKV